MAEGYNYREGRPRSSRSLVYQADEDQFQPADTDARSPPLISRSTPSVSPIPLDAEPSERSLPADEVTSRGLKARAAAYSEHRRIEPSSQGPLGSASKYRTSRPGDGSWLPELLEPLLEKRIPLKPSLSRAQESVNSDCKFAEIEENGALSDPTRYYEAMEDMESFVYSTCKQALDQLGTRRSSWLPPMVPIRQCLRSTNQSISRMQTAGFCSNHIFMTVLVEPQLAKVVGIRIADIHAIETELFLEGPGILRPSLMSKVRGILLLLTGTDVFQDVNAEPGYLLFVLCRLLAWSTIAYAGSLCSQRHIATGIENIDLAAAWPPLHSSKTTFENGLRLGKSTLTCLDAFLNGPIWVLYRGATLPQKLDLSLTIAQLADLWGPVFAIPKEPPSFEQLLALGLDGGLLYRVSDGPESEAVRLHYVPAEPFRAGTTNMPSSTLEVRTTNGEEPPKQFLPFAPDSRVVIGFTDILEINSDCGLKPAAVEKFAHHLLPIGTHQSFWAPDEFQIGFAGGQYVNVNLQKNYKRRPGTTWKQSFLERCSKRRAEFCAFLDWHVGLELSLCTKSARRIPLREVIALAFPQDSGTLGSKASITNAQLDDLFNKMLDLKHTGMDPEGKFKVFWPMQSGAIAEVYDVQDYPGWATLLRDTHDSACFASASLNCLTYHKRQKQWSKLPDVVANGCCCQHGSPTRPMLETRVQLNPQFYHCLREGTRLKFGNATIEIKVPHHKAHLAQYLPATLFSRVRDGLVQSADSERGRVHRELFNMDRAHMGRTIRIGIVDSKATKSCH